MTKKHVLKYAGMACAILCLGLVTTSTRASESFSFNDIHYWIGEGTNRAGIVVDWNNGRPGSSLAWGIRWNGASTNLTEILEVLSHQDRRLYVAASGGFVTGFAYDVKNSGALFDLSMPGAATDAAALVNIDDYNKTGYWWTLTKTNAAFVLASAEWTSSRSGASGSFPVDEDWYGFKRISNAWPSVDSSTPALPVAAESPFAFKVAACVIDADASGDYSDSAAVLGAPSTYVSGGGYGPDSIVTPGAQPWSPHQLLTLAKATDDTGGYVVVEFDHRIMDHPQNPYGLDFIVFGNASQTLGDGQYFDGTDDPGGYVFKTSELAAEPGIVAVSQNGTDWFTYTDGPFADTFAPTMSHLYDTNSPDASLFAGNKWWGRLADPTLPIDPALAAADFVGRTLAEYAMLYNGSAGGTGFDISGFDLPVDLETGLKWIQYVRVTSLATYDPDDPDATPLWTEVDAFAAVSPALPYDNWVRDNYDWTQLPDPTIVGKKVVAGNGKPNFYNAAFGIAPDATAVESFSISSFTLEDGRAIFRVPFATDAFDAFRIGKASVVDGPYKNHLLIYEGSVDTGTGFESVFSIPVEADSDAAFYKIGISAK